MRLRCRKDGEGYTFEKVSRIAGRERPIKKFGRKNPGLFGNAV